MSQCLCDCCDILQMRYEPVKWSMSVYANGAQVVNQWPTTARQFHMQPAILPRGKVGNQFWGMGSGVNTVNGFTPPVQQGNVNVWFWNPTIDGDDPIGEWHQPLITNYWLGYVNTTPVVSAWQFTHDDYAIGPLRNTYPADSGLGVYGENFTVVGTTGLATIISAFGYSNIVYPPSPYQQWCGAVYNWEDGVFGSSYSIVSAVARKRTTFGAVDTETAVTFDPPYNTRPGGGSISLWSSSIVGDTGTLLVMNAGLFLGTPEMIIVHPATGKWTISFGPPAGAFADRVYFTYTVGFSAGWGATTYPWIGGVNNWIRTDSLNSAWYGSVPGFSNANAIFRGASRDFGQWAIPTKAGGSPHLRLLRFAYGSASGSAPASTIDCSPFVSSGITGLGVSWVETPPGYYYVAATLPDVNYPGKNMLEFQHIDINGNVLHHGIWHGLNPTPPINSAPQITHYRPNGQHVYFSEIPSWDRPLLPVHELLV